MASLPLRRARWCGRNLVLLEEVDSTNTYLKQGDFPDGTAVIALRQTAGKGRTGRVWTGAEPGQGLYLSVLFHSMQIEDMGFLPLLCGLAVAKTLGRGAAIKWPNDVLIGNVVNDQLLKSQDWPFAAALAVVLLIVTWLIMTLHRRAGGKSSDMTLF